jgi:uncharacterized protein (TIGR03435 family)
MLPHSFCATLAGYLCCGAVVAAGFIQTTSQPAQGNDVPPPLRLAALWQAPADARADWAALRGKVVVLEFWATWCGGCVAAFPHMNELVDELKSEPIVFISITDEKNEDYVRKFLTKRPLKTWVGIDGERGLYKAFKITGIPRTIIVGRDGKIAGDTYPTNVTPAILRDIIAGKTPTWPKDTVQQVEELDPGGGPAAMFQMWFKPPGDTPGGRMSVGRRDVAWTGLPLSDMICTAYAVSAARIVDEAPEITGKSCEFFLRLPRANGEALHRMWQVGIETTFDLSISREKRERDVYVLTPAADGKHRLKRSEFDTAVPPSRYARDLLTGDGVTLANISRDFEGRLATPVLDETGLDGRWDYELHFTDAKLPAFAAAVREQLGLELVPARRVVEVLVIKSNSAAASQSAP